MSCENCNPYVVEDIRIVREVMRDLGIPFTRASMKEALQRGVANKFVVIPNFKDEIEEGDGHYVTAGYNGALLDVAEILREQGFTVTSYKES